MDASVGGEVFSSRPTLAAKPPSAGEKFLDWVNKGTGRLIIGGKLLKELNAASKEFRMWGQQALLSGRMRREDEERVRERTAELRAEGTCKSNDPHVLALAQISGARLLYSNDGALHQDFKNKSLIDNPRGKVYSTLKDKDFTNDHRKLLANGNLCRVGQ